MDIKIEKKRGISRIFTKKALPYWAGVIFLVFIVWLIVRPNRKVLVTDADTVTIADVMKGEFNDYVRITGQVEPITTVQISPLESGIVESIPVEEGAMVHKGETILVLNNNTLNLEILNAESQLAEKQDMLRNTQISMEQEKLTLRQEKLELDLDVQRKKRVFEQNTVLHDKTLLATETWLQSKEDYELAVRKRKLILDRQIQDSLYRQVQASQMQESLDNMRLNMKLIRERVSNLNVKSPIDGELGQLDVVLGQSVGMGQKVGQLNDLSDYKIVAEIDEHYIDRVHKGLEASFERQSSTFDTKIRKVYPEVHNGQFKADLVFSGQRPENIRTGQTYYMNLELGEPTEALVIPRGSFFQNTGGAWIYVVSKDGSKAVKRNIRIGRQNPQYYEVLEGLDSGEKVIVSSYDNFGDNDELILK
ncbi:MAG: efflux RND transporter periplasmic adaptor subunit [Bacteroidales bacterium]|jgi:HlyD family secretion protein|nr:efflux RND transporter periplasmic adaptor subunit [Bacteroidales bacterium]MCI2122175.1 efflux RND transporter periplasmic adaptor subunit [Bacteroidales bacterium]MCI2145164.1 efflux RND transporter periplasmic adaptor subunit [Bacteroidales bacterium]